MAKVGWFEDEGHGARRDAEKQARLWRNEKRPPPRAAFKSGQGFGRCALVALGGGKYGRVGLAAVMPITKSAIGSIGSCEKEAALMQSRRPK
jgi:hypothetical protein